MFNFVELEEKQLRQLSDAQAAWRNFVLARNEAAEVRGSMRWKTVGQRQYLVRVSPAGAETGLGPQDERTQAIFEAFHARKAPAQARLKAMKALVDEQRKLNRVFRVGRTPAVVVRCLAAIDEARLADQFMTVGTHALYAYETACGVRVEPGAVATRDLDLLFDTSKLRAYTATLKRGDVRSLINVLRQADPTFRVKADQLQTAVNDDGFEVDVIRRVANAQDPHPLRMSDQEDDFWAVQVDQGEKIASGERPFDRLRANGVGLRANGRRFEQLVISANGEMASMRTLHPLDFVRLKRELAAKPWRDPLKAPKDRLQANVVQSLWDQYLAALDRSSNTVPPASTRPPQI